MNNIKDTQLDKPIKWVIKKVKNADHLKEIPYDILKQMMAVKIAESFS